MFHNEKLSKYTTLNVGGSAELLFKPQNKKELKNFLKENTKQVFVMGGGTNLLIRDGGISGIVILLKNTLNKITLKNGILKVGCGIFNKKIYNFCLENEIAGYEWLATIPGTLGGAINGNAGCYGQEIKDFLLEVEALDFKGNIKKITIDKCHFDYRKNNLPENLIFVSAKLRANEKGNKIDIEKKYNDFIEKRKLTQPIGEKTAGSTFKNLPDIPAWKVVQELGYQNKEIAGVKISEKHANFVINTGKATAKSIENLINAIKIDAKNKMGINLECEIKIVGKK